VCHRCPDRRPGHGDHVKTNASPVPGSPIRTLPRRSGSPERLLRDMRRIIRLRGEGAARWGLGLQDKAHSRALSARELSLEESANGRGFLLIHREVSSCISLEPGRPSQQEPAQGGRGWPTMKWLASQGQIWGFVAFRRGYDGNREDRAELSHSTIRARGARVDPSAGRNRSDEVSRSTRLRRLSATHAVTTFGQLVSAEKRAAWP